MKKAKHISAIAAYLCLLILVFLLLNACMGYKNAGPEVEDVTYLNTFTVSVDGGPKRILSLPYTFEYLQPRTPVTLTTTITPHLFDAIYIKSVYSPARIYLNEQLVYEFGKRDNYPGFMADPATEVHMVETHGTDQPMSLRMEFLSPVSRSSMIIHPPILGSTKEIILERFHALGIPFVLSISQIVYGISLLLISMCIGFMDQKGVVFLWLGLLSFLTGLWSFGENNFTGIIFKNSTFLYLISFIGFFTFVLPLLRFARTAIDFEHPEVLWYMELGVTVICGISFLLQFLGILPFTQSMYLFHLLLPSVLLFLTGWTIFEFVRYKNVSAKRFIFSTCFLSVCSLLELANYRISFTYVFSSMFQLGIIVFLLVTGITAGLSVKDSLDLKNRKKELAFEQGLMDIQIKEQQHRGLLLAEHQQKLSRQRHDLRHHLTVLRELADEDPDKLKDYLDTLMDNIPSARKSFCENDAVNSIISHYNTICKANDIDFSVSLAVPDQNKHISDGDLCAIFGNLVENAVEACCRQTTGSRFIKLSSQVHRNFLTITMDNSFDGKIEIEGNRFRSSKRDDFGIGIASIKSIAQNARGDADFKQEGNVFLSSVYVIL